MITTTADPLSLVFGALADPTRRAILSRLSSGPSTVGDLAAPFDMSGPAVSQHLNVLERAGLIERTRQGHWRNCSLKPESLDEAADWVERHRVEWNEKFHLLDERLRVLKEGEK